MTLTALLRFYTLGAQSLWADEGNSVALARRGFVEIAQRTAFDIHPPLYYWLLKIWTTFFGDSEIGLRSLSAMLGVGLVYLIWLLGRRLFGQQVGLAAAFIAALSPLQVYYAQEARMYMLLAFLGSLTVLLAKDIIDHPRSRWLQFAYILTVTAGLYTHYAFPVMLIVVNLMALWFFARNSALNPPSSDFLTWLALQVIPLLFYLPWLPTAWRQVTTWPSEQRAETGGVMLGAITETLLVGVSWPYDWTGFWRLGFGLVIIFWGATLLLGRRTFSPSGVDLEAGLTHSPSPQPSPRGRGSFSSPPLGGIEGGLSTRESLAIGWDRRVSLLLLWLWLLLPLSLTLYIYSPAFLKFLLVAAPALALWLGLVSVGLARSVRPRWRGYLSGGALLSLTAAASLLSLYHYYANQDFARDNYRDIVQFIKAVGDAQDAIILNAEGQQDVFNYYYRQPPLLDAAVHPLPQQRPLDEAAVIAELQSIANNAEDVYAVYWAAHQADPAGVIESWLDAHLFKATDQWYGNVRLVNYAAPQLEPNFTAVDYGLGEDIRLTGYQLSSPQVTPGDVLQVSLQWQTETALSRDLMVFLQVLDQNNQLVGQRDAMPLIATTAWPPGEPVRDGHGIFIEPGTPPGPHRLIVGLYDPQTGQRLPATGAEQSGANFIELDTLEIRPPANPLPEAAFHIQEPLHHTEAGLALLGYDLYKVGHRSTPETPLRLGDPVQLTAYWQRQQPNANLASQVEIELIEQGGGSGTVVLTAPLAGVDYPLERWQVGEIARAQYVFFLDGIAPGRYFLRLSVAGEDAETGFQGRTRSFRVE